MIEIIQHTWPHPMPKIHGIQPYFDLIFADPPYNYGIEYVDDIFGDKLPADKYRSVVRCTLGELFRSLRPGGTLWWLCPAEHGEWVWPILTEHGSLLQGKPIIWHERFSQYQRTKLTSDYRLLFPVVKPDGAITFNPSDIREQSVRQQMGDKRANPDGRVPGHVWRVSRLQGNAKTRVSWHPAQLPTPPLERIINGWTNSGDMVLDAFAGSGSMGLVCSALGRNFVGVDASGTYCNALRNRLGDSNGNDE